MKNDANPPSTTATIASMKMMPVLVAIASGESLLPKHTGHASAACGVARSPMVSSVFRISDRSAKAFALQPSRLPLERRAVTRQPDTACERGRAGHGVRHGVRRLILPHRPGRHERG